MPSTPHIPAYRLHKSSGQARVILRTKHVYLGQYGTPESWEKYQRLIAEQITGGVPTPAVTTLVTSRPVLLIKELILMYWQHAQTYYVKNGQPTDEQGGIRAALRDARWLYGSTPASEFGPLKLKAVRQAMIDADCCAVLSTSTSTACGELSAGRWRTSWCRSLRIRLWRK